MLWPSEIIFRTQTFKPTNGGLGATLSCTSTSSRVALPAGTGGQLLIQNISDNWAYIRLLTSDSGEATADYLGIGPGNEYIYTLVGEGSVAESNDGVYTHVAGICASGETATLKFFRGAGD